MGRTLRHPTCQGDAQLGPLQELHRRAGRATRASSGGCGGGGAGPGPGSSAGRSGANLLLQHRQPPAPPSSPGLGSSSPAPPAPPSTMGVAGIAGSAGHSNTPSMPRCGWLAVVETRRCRREWSDSRDMRYTVRSPGLRPGPGPASRATGWWRGPVIRRIAYGQAPRPAGCSPACSSSNRASLRRIVSSESEDNDDADKGNPAELPAPLLHSDLANPGPKVRKSAWVPGPPSGRQLCSRSDGC